MISLVSRDETEAQLAVRSLGLNTVHFESRRTEISLIKNLLIKVLSLGEKSRNSIADISQNPSCKSFVVITPQNLSV